jgi:hypothetical protein
MSHASVYVKTIDRGAQLAELRLLAGDRDDLWVAPSNENRRPDDPPPEHEREAAGWLRDALATDKRTRDQLTAVVLDGTGSLFTWSEVPAGVGPKAVVDAIRRGGRSTGQTGAHDAEVSSPIALAPELDLPEGLSIEAMGSEADPLADSELGSTRVGMSAVPDLAARLLLDQLDAQGVQVERVLTVWQAIALAWSTAPHQSKAQQSAHPRSNASADSAGVVEVASSMTTAVVVLDASSRRFLWVWTVQGEPIASGWGRLARDGSVPASVVSRLCLEWIGWGSQMGRSPGRILVVQPDAMVGPGGITPAAMIARQWPDATLDAVSLEDPLLATLARAADRIAGDTNAPASAGLMQELTYRPGRLDRSSRLWVGAAMLAAAAALGIAAWKLGQASAQTAQQAQETRQTWRERATAIDPRALEPGVLDPILYLRDQVAQAQRQVAPVARRRPIMRELESIALVIGYNNVRLQEIKLSQVNAMLRIRVDNTQSYEELRSAMSSVAGSELADWTASSRSVGNGPEVEASFQSLWRRMPTGGPQGGN